MRTSVDVANFLIEREAAHEIFSARGRLRTPERIAAVLDLPPQEVGKVTIFEAEGRQVAAVIPSGLESDLARVRRASGSQDLEPVTTERASELTGFLSESIPPAGLPNGFLLVVDRSLDRDAVLYFHGGEARAILKIRGKDLVRATRAKVATITR